MKKATRFFASVLMAAMMLAMFTSCKKTPSDTVAFIALAEKYHYKVHDVTEQYINAPQIRSGTLAAPEDRAFQIEFYIITDTESAKELFQAQSKEMDGAKGTTWTGDISNGRNYAKNTIVTDGKYMMLCYVENTMLYVPPTKKENKEAIEAFVDEFKY